MTCSCEFEYYNDPRFRTHLLCNVHQRGNTTYTICINQIALNTVCIICALKRSDEKIFNFIFPAIIINCWVVPLVFYRVASIAHKIFRVENFCRREFVRAILEIILDLINMPRRITSHHRPVFTEINLIIITKIANFAYLCRVTAQAFVHII